MNIDRLIDRIKASTTLSETQKARLIAMCERIRSVARGIRTILRNLWAWMVIRAAAT